MKTNELNEKLRAAFGDVWKKSPKMVEYNMNDTAAACQLSNGMILTTDKQRIEKNFCFGYSTCGQGPEHDEASEAADEARNAEYFYRKNMKWYENRLEQIDGQEYYPLLYPKYYSQSETNPLREVCFVRLWDLLDRINYDEMKPGATLTDKRGDIVYIPTQDDMNRIRAMYTEASLKHEKKVRAYLKRYGVSKVRTWTFWLDE